MKEDMKDLLRKLRERMNDQPVDLGPPYASVRIDLLEQLFSFIPASDVIAIFPQGMDLAYIPDLKKAFGPGLTVAPYVGGGFQVLKTNQPTQ